MYISTVGLHGHMSLLVADVAELIAKKGGSCQMLVCKSRGTCVNAMDPLRGSIPM